MLFCGEVGSGDMLKSVWCFPFTFLICRFVTIKYKKKSVTRHHSSPYLALAHHEHTSSRYVTLTFKANKESDVGIELNCAAVSVSAKL